MSKVTFELESEMVDRVIVEELINSRISLLSDYENGGNAVFDVDPDEDRKQIGELIKSIERVIDWYSIPGTYIFDELPAVEPVREARDLGN